MCTNMHQALPLAAKIEVAKTDDRLGNLVGGCQVDAIAFSGLSDYESMHLFTAVPVQQVCARAHERRGQHAMTCSVKCNCESVSSFGQHNWLQLLNEPAKQHVASAGKDDKA